jgi:hypothetical protein
MAMAVLGLVTALSARAAAPIESGRDYHSFANLDSFRVSNIVLELRVDFEAKQLHGAVT